MNRQIKFPMVAVLSREKPLCGALIQKDRSPWPWPSRPYLPWLSTASSVLFPHVLETFRAFGAPSYTFSPPNLIASIRRENFSFWYSLHFSRREICDSPLPDGTLQRLGHLSCFFFFFFQKCVGGNFYLQLCSGWACHRNSKLNVLLKYKFFFLIWGKISGLLNLHLNKHCKY